MARLVSEYSYFCQQCSEEDKFCGKEYKFIGSQVERSEFPGCILWNGSNVEFNDHRRQRRGCNVHAQGGECLCTSAP